MGANVRSHQAMSGDVQRVLLQGNGTSGDVRLHRATGWS